MAERDKVIKSGQITLPRILFLVVVGSTIFLTVYAGGVFLSLGYWFITLAICGLLFLIAIDYGVDMERISTTVRPAQAAAAVIEPADPAAASLKTTLGEARPKKRTARPAKRRR